MKAKVIKRFRDKHTKELFDKGASYDSEADRVTELQSLGYVEVEKTETDPRLEGNAEQVKQAIDGLDREELEKLLAEEKENKNRKGVVEYFERLLSVFKEGE